ncbi:hypothetical protein AB205_0215490 [Aquarana catesbeiana]|uniref:Uncharacterized protein n=1 Tax=Aquarana catesbeiana TaxID=8400 RepID=A0A2G9QCT7_AQUCT|nr:hypothetical protein AB205_0215490 [Aquarana catesbeiana]
MRSPSSWLIKIVSRPSAAGGRGRRSRSPPRQQRAVSSSQRGRFRRRRLRQQLPHLLRLSRRWRRPAL